MKAVDTPLLTTVDGSPVSDPLHDHRHGVDAVFPHCACGNTTSSGTVCPLCGTRTRLDPGTERYTFRYRIPLAQAVRHPWAPDDREWDLYAIPLLPPHFRPYRENRLDQVYRRLIVENEKAKDNPVRGSRTLSGCGG